MSEAAVRPQYPNPPIQEALCQITFAEPLAWNVATPGLLFERLRGHYPQEPESQEQLEATVQVDNGAQGSHNVAFNRGQQRFIYRDDSRTRLVVASPLTFSANSLPPYEGWPGLRDRFEEAIAHLAEVTPLKPVVRVALRYINRISIAEPSLDTDDFFKVTVRTADNGNATFKGFMHRVESVLDDETVIVSTFATMDNPDPHESTFLLDLDCRRADLELEEVSEILEVADNLKVIENREFESCITDATRELFQ